MCIAIPGKIVELNKEIGKAKVSFSGNLIDISTGLVDAEMGQYVLVHAGCAIEVMEKEKAEELIEIFSDIEGI